MILGYSVFVLAFNFALYTTLWLLYKYNFKYYSYRNEELPEVSILIAVRNEEQNIPDLLRDLNDLYNTPHN